MAAKKSTSNKKETKKPAASKKSTSEKSGASGSDAKKAASKKAEPKPASKPEPTLKGFQRTMEKFERENAKLKDEIKALKDTGREQKKKLKSLTSKMETRTKREEIIMSTLDINTRTKKGQRSAVSDLNRSLIKTDEHLLKLSKRMENVLSAIKNHREYLIRLNKRVYKENPVKLIEMELDVMCNTLNVMALSGFGIDKGLFNDVKKIRKLMDKKDIELSNIKKRMSTFTRKFDDEMERFDFESIYKKAEHIPGYR
ncbi:MAG: hypothetical protein KAR56_03200 [Thermoplasmata archaeon]|nr:hypothetical protein [Thermoplasmata archaeon]